MSAKRIHEPWLMSQSEMQQFGVSIGQDYAAPIPAAQLVRPHGGEQPGSHCLVMGFVCSEKAADKLWHTLSVGAVLEWQACHGLQL